MFLDFFNSFPSINYTEIVKSLSVFLEDSFSIIWQIIKNWFWLPLPFFLWKHFTFIWLWWRQDVFSKKVKNILLEIKLPDKISKPIRAMETVMAALRQTLYQPPNSWEKWIEGQYQSSYSFEIVSIGGEVHFFIRVKEDVRDSVESIIYGQFPEVEISVAEDYTKKVPIDIPNKEWDMWGADYTFLKPNPYPIKTYPYFEKETAVEAAEEEKIVDPLANLLEAMSRIQPGEQLWIQIIAKPITDKEVPWITEGKKIRDEIAKRETKKPPRKSIIREAFDLLFFGKVPNSSSEGSKDTPMPEMTLTPGEKEIIKAIEDKISKPAFRCNIRFIFLGKRDVFKKANLRLVFGFFASFSMENINYLVPLGKTITKIAKSWFLPLNLLINRRLYMRQRRLFRSYIRRINTLFPFSEGDYKTGTIVLNVEELATLFHFPSRKTAPAPSLARIGVKKEAPPQLPTG